MRFSSVPASPRFLRAVCSLLFLLLTSPALASGGNASSGAVTPPSMSLVEETEEQAIREPAEPLLAQRGRYRDREGNRVVLGEGTVEWRDGQADGLLDADSVAEGCLGLVNEIPDFILEVRTDSWVRVTVMASDFDPTLVLVGDDEDYCNDDSSDLGNNPELTTFLLAGEYFVYVGRSSQEHSGEYEIRFMTESTSSLTNVGRRTGTFQLSGMSGGDIPANTRFEGCPGAISQSPSHVLDLRRPMYLDLAANSVSDLVLLVASDRGVACNDDAVGTLDPHIVDWFPRGFVRIYVGSHNPSISAPYTLTVTPHMATTRRHHDDEKCSKPR